MKNYTINVDDFTATKKSENEFTHALVSSETEESIASRIKVLEEENAQTFKAVADYTERKARVEAGEATGVDAQWTPEIWDQWIEKFSAKLTENTSEIYGLRKSLEDGGPYAVDAVVSWHGTPEAAITAMKNRKDSKAYVVVEIATSKPVVEADVVVEEETDAKGLSTCENRLAIAEYLSKTSDTIKGIAAATGIHHRTVRATILAGASQGHTEEERFAKYGLPAASFVCVGKESRAKIWTVAK